MSALAEPLARAPARTGRKPLPAEQKRRRQNLFLTPPVQRWLEDQTAALGLPSVSQTVEHLLRTHPDYRRSDKRP